MGKHENSEYHRGQIDGQKMDAFDKNLHDMASVVVSNKAYDEGVENGYLNKPHETGGVKGTGGGNEGHDYTGYDSGNNEPEGEISEEAKQQILEENERFKSHFYGGLLGIATVIALLTSGALKHESSYSASKIPEPYFVSATIKSKDGIWVDSINIDTNRFLINRKTKVTPGQYPEFFKGLDIDGNGRVSVREFEILEQYLPSVLGNQFNRKEMIDYLNGKDSLDSGGYRTLTARDIYGNVISKQLGLKPFSKELEDILTKEEIK